MVERFATCLTITNKRGDNVYDLKKVVLPPVKQVLLTLPEHMSSPRF